MRTLSTLALLTLFNLSAWGQIAVSSDGLENGSTVFTTSGGTFYTGNSDSGDRPVSTPFCAEGSYSYGTSNGTATLTSGDLNTSAYTMMEMTLRVASFSIGSTINGADAPDYVKVEISPDGGANYYNTVQINGNNNACWSFTGGTGIASVEYDGDASAVTFAPGGGGTRTTDGYSTIAITNLPAVSILRIRIILLNNSANELWLVDDFKITGSIAGIPSKLVVVSTNGGNNPSVGVPFDVVVQSQDSSGALQPVSSNTDIALSLASGSGSLEGTLEGTILTGQNSATISGVTYKTAESGVSITASATAGNALTSGTGATFTVLTAASQLALVNVPTAGQQGVKLGTFTAEARRGDNSVDQNFTGNIAVGKASGPGNISGTLTQAAVSGVAIFDDIQFDAGGDYTISASFSGLTGTTSGTVHIHSTALPLFENFNYSAGTTLVFNGWTAHSAAGTNSITVSPGALTYPGYASSGVGNKIIVVNTGEDVNRLFTPVTSGSVTVSFLVNVSKAGPGDYFMNFSQNPFSLSAYRGRVFVRLADNGKLTFGVSKSVTTPVYADSVYDLNTTHLVVLKYIFGVGVSLWVDPALGGSEPAPTVAQTDGGADPASIGAIAIRQGNSGIAPTLTLSGLRVAASRIDIPLPVAMTSIGARSDAGRVYLSFSTATEIDIAGFNILRSLAKDGQFQLVSSHTSNESLKAAGTAANGGSYTFEDAKVSGGRTYYYRIDAVSISGEVSRIGEVIEVDVAVPKNFAVYQNYPNPFNPSTTIRYDLKEQSNVRLDVYNLLGMKVRSESSQKEAGTFDTQIDLDNMPSGIYFFRMMIDGKSGSCFVSTKKALLMK